MKKKFVLLTIAMLAICVARAQGQWIDYKIDNKLSIKLPVEPTKTDDYSVMAQTQDTVVFVISVIDLKKVANIDSTALAGMATSPEFTGGIKNGMVGKMPGFTLGDMKVSTWNGYHCYNVEGSNPSSKLKTYSFMVIIGSTLYSTTAILADDKSQKEKDDFFASLKLN